MPKGTANETYPRLKAGPYQHRKPFKKCLTFGGLTLNQMKPSDVELAVMKLCNLV